MLNSCDKYDKVKESFDEYYEPIKEQYHEITKISPNLFAVSSQKIIQGIFDNIDAGFGVPDDFCSVLRGEIEPILRRLGMSPEEILEEFLSEQPKAIQSGVSINSSSTTSAVSSVGTSSISPTVIASIVIAVVAIAGVGGTCALGIICPQETLITILDSPLGGKFKNTDTLDFKWHINSNQDSVKHYIIEIKKLDDKTIPNTPVNSNSYSAKHLDVGEYSWRVKAVEDSGNNSDFSDSFNFIIKPIDKQSPPK